MKVLRIYFSLYVYFKSVFNVLLEKDSFTVWRDQSIFKIWRPEEMITQAQKKHHSGILWMVFGNVKAARPPRENHHN